MLRCKTGFGPESLSTVAAGGSRVMCPEETGTNLKDLFTIGATTFTEVARSLDERTQEACPELPGLWLRRNSCLRLTVSHGWWKKCDKDNLGSRSYRCDRRCAVLVLRRIMSTRKAPRKTRQAAPTATGPLRNSHKVALRKIWDERPCLPSAASRKRWASARGIEPTSVNRWFYAQIQRAEAAGFELHAGHEGYDLDVEGGSPVERLVPIEPPLKRDSLLHPTTPVDLPELSSYEYSASSETGLRIPFTPGQTPSPIFGSSFYSPKLTLVSSPGAYGHFLGVERFLFTPPSPPKHERIAPSRTHSRRLAEEHQIQIPRSAYPLPFSSIPDSRPPPLPLAPRKPRPSRGSHDILNFRIQDDPCLRFSPLISSPTPIASGYSVPYHIGPLEPKADDKPNLSTFSDLPIPVAKTSRPTDHKRGRCTGAIDLRIVEIIKPRLHSPSVCGR